MAEVPLCVVDASVSARWRLKDEPHSAFADKVQRDYEDGRIALVAPDHFRYEVTSAFRKAVLNNRLTIPQGREAIQDFLAWQIPTVDATSLIAPAYEMCWRYSCTLYDGLYLALAESQQLPFLYADNRLRNALGNRFPLAVWIENYQSSS